MKNYETKIWLRKLFNSSYFNTWMVVSYMYRYPSAGIQQYLCNKLYYKNDIFVVLPELVHIFFYFTDDIVSFPIFNLFIFHCRRSRKFCLALYFMLNCYKQNLSNEKIIYLDLLVGEILKIDSKRNRNICFKRKIKFKKQKNGSKGSLKLQILTKRSDYKKEISYLNHKTKQLKCNQRGYPNLQGILIFFVKAVSCILNEKLFASLKNYEKIFLNFKNAKSSLNFENKTFSGLAFSKNGIAGNIFFLEELVNISKRLKNIPKETRQKALFIELSILNMNLPAPVNLPFGSNHYVLRAAIDNSIVLDSAENSPFLVIFEIASEICKKKCEINEKTVNAALLLRQLNNINKQKNIPETNIIRERIIEKLDSLNTENYSDRKAIFNNESVIEDWEMKKKNIRKNSEYSSLKGWNIKSVIVKSGSDLRQEMIASQLLLEMKNIWKEESRDIWVINYQIYLLGSDCGLIETINDALSIHAIKKRGQRYKRKSFFLKSFFLEIFGEECSEKYKLALNSFLRSLVGYSLATYFLQIKDRHNGNIMIDRHGHIIHVDFGFILGDHPGFYNVEIAPFKFSTEYADLLGENLNEFRRLFLEGFLSLRKYSDRLCRIIEIMMGNSQIKCLNKNVLSSFRERFKLEMSDKEIEKYVLDLVDWSLNSLSTGFYDSFQYFSQGYLK